MWTEFANQRETQREKADTVRDTEIDTGSDSDEVEGETKENGGRTNNTKVSCTISPGANLGISWPKRQIERTKREKGVGSMIVGVSVSRVTIL